CRSSRSAPRVVALVRRAGADAALGAAGPAVIDVRDPAAFAAGHLAASGHVPRAELRERRAELPPREQPVLVVDDDPAAAEAGAAGLGSWGFAGVAWLAVPLGAVPGGCLHRGPAVRLWRPARFLEEVLPAIPRGLAADLAAGAGRDAVYLALNGFEVDAFDHDPEPLGRTAALARREGVSVRTIVAALGTAGPRARAPARSRLVPVFRSLPRPLFAAIERALAPGGWLVYETYREGQERFGRPKSARFLLRAGELSSAFPALTVVRYD